MLYSLIVVSWISTFAVQGFVHASDSGEPIDQVLVEVIGGQQRAWSDSLGAYRVTDLSEGTHQLRFSRMGYEARTVDVFVGAERLMRLDVTMRPHSLDLTPLVILGGHSATGSERLATTLLDYRLGSHTVSGSWLHANPFFDDADVLQTLALSPDVMMSPESPTALHVRGGSADQNLVLLDGIPTYNPYHARGALSAFSPDIVSEVTMHAGVPSARLGDAISSVIEVRTDDPPPDGVVARGAVGPMSLRAMAGISFPSARGGLIVAGRRSTRDLLSVMGGQTSTTADFQDFLAKGTVYLGHGKLTVLGFGSRDRIAFGSQGDINDAPDLNVGPDENSGDLQQSGSLSGAQNRFDWSSATQGIAWRSDCGSCLHLEARAWRTAFTGTVDWQTDTAPIRLSSQVRHLGVGADVDWTIAGTRAAAGLTLQRMGTRYIVVEGPTAATMDSSPRPLLDLRSAPAEVSAYVEDRWAATSRLAFTTGVRIGLVPARFVDLEPRLSIQLAPSRDLVLSAGYARTHQYLQSLRNEESVTAAVFGLSLPIAADVAGAQRARSDQLTVAADASLANGTHLLVNAYVRWLDNLLLAAPATGQPFVTDTWKSGVGRAAGLTIVLEHRNGRLFGQAAYGLGSATRRAGTDSYRLAATTTHSLRIAVGYRVRARTTIHAAFRAAVGRPTSLVADDFEWAPYNPIGGGGDITGSPQRIAGPLNAYALPSYVRVDLGLRHERRLVFFGHEAHVTAVLSVMNILGRSNTLGVVRVPGEPGGQRQLAMLPRSLSVRLEWRY